MKEIKFRVWGIDINGTGEKVMSYSGDIRDTDTSRRVFSQWEDEDLNELNPWMQDTGFKDKDYRSIYEADVVRTRDAGDGIVMMHENGFWAIKLFNIQGQPEHHLYSLVIALGGCEVIGNKYENPELLGIS